MSSHSSRRSTRKPPKPLDSVILRDLAITYVARYATTRAKLAAYLHRKLRERGWQGDEAADPEAIAERFVELGYIDDARFAEQKAGSLLARGYGGRRVGQALFAAGISESDGEGARQMVQDETWAAALTFARKRRLGPYSHEPPDRDMRQKQLQAFVRAGHGFSVAKRIVFADSEATLAEALAGESDIDPEFVASEFGDLE